MRTIALNINNSTCIKCGKCVRVCPSLIFKQTEPRGEITSENESGCIACGHCVAACPTNSVIHSSFPAEKIHAIDRSLLPTPDQVMLLCKARRSNRAFSPQPVPREALEQILEAAHRAPTASNAQQVAFTIITDPEKLQQVTTFTIGVFSSLVKRLENPILKLFLKPLLPGVYNYLPAFHRLENEHTKGNDLILRKATALIFIHTPKESRFGCQDANLAYQNGSLMAESLGINQFYTGFVCTAIQQDKKNQLARSLGIQGTIHAGMALGLPDFKFPNYMDKEDVQVTWKA